MEVRGTWTDSNGRLAASLLTIPVSPAMIRPPASIPSTGDVTDQVNAWLASSEVPAGARIDMNGIDWTCERAIKLTSKPVALVGDWWLRRTTKGPRPRPPAWTQPHLWLHPQSRVELGTSGGLKILGTNRYADPLDGGGSPSWPVAYFADYEFEAGVRIDNPAGALVQWQSIDGVWGDGVQFGGRTGTGVEFGGVPGSRAYLGSVGRQGFTPGSYGCDAHDIDLAWGRRSGFDLEPDSANTRFGQSTFRRMSLRCLQLPVASAGSGDCSDVLLEDIQELATSMPVITARSSNAEGRRDRWTVRRWSGTPTNTSVGTPALRIGRGRDWLIEDCVGFGATGVAGAVKGIEFAACGGRNVVRGNDLRPKGTIVHTSDEPDFELVLNDERVGGQSDSNRYV